MIFRVLKSLIPRQVFGMGIGPLAALGISAGIQGIGALVNKFTQKDLPTYQPQPYAFDLPQQAQQFLGDISGAEMTGLNRRFEQLATDIGGRRAAQGITGGVSVTEGTGFGRARSEAIQGLLSTQAQRQLSLLDIINRFGQGERGMEFGSQQAQTQQQNLANQQFAGGLTGAAQIIPTGLREEQLFKQIMAAYGGGQQTPIGAGGGQQMAGLGIQAPEFNFRAPESVFDSPFGQGGF